MNHHLHEFIKVLEDKYSIDSMGLTVEEWVSKNTMLKGKAFSVDKYPFQRGILNDMHPSVMVKKISQVGLTEIQMRKMVAFLYRNTNTQGLFSFPDKALRDAFAKTRLRPLLDQNKVFNAIEGMKQTRSVEIAQVGSSFLHVVLGNESAATSLTIDFMCIDEVDLTDQEILGLYDSRLQGSDFRIRHDFSTPTFEDYGIDAGFKLTDQREYVCKCSGCGHWQVPDWDRKFVHIPGLSSDIALEDITEHMLGELDLEKSVVHCEKCGRKLDLHSPDREWVTVYPSKSDMAHGYWVRCFSSGGLSVEYIVKSLIKFKKRDFIRGFYNTVVGRTYADAKTRLQEGIIRENMHGEGPVEIDKEAQFFIGIDVGLICHVVGGYAKGVEDVQAVLFDEVPIGRLGEYLQTIAAQYNLVCGVIDRMPYTPTAQDVHVQTGHRVVPAQYVDTGPTFKEVKQNEFTDVSEDERYFQVNRTWILDQVAKLVRMKKLPMRGYGNCKDNIRDHLQNMVRVEEPEKPAVWKKLTRDDHFFHAIGYFLLSIRILEYERGVLNAGQETRSCYGILTSDMIIPDFGVVMGKKPPPGVETFTHILG